MAKIRLPADQGAFIAERIIEIIQAARDEDGTLSADAKRAITDTVEREFGKDLADLMRAGQELRFELDYSAHASA